MPYVSLYWSKSKLNIKMHIKYIIKVDINIVNLCFKSLKFKDFNIFRLYFFLIIVRVIKNLRYPYRRI